MSNSLPGLYFPSVPKHNVIASFDGGDLTSDAGMLLLTLADEKVGLLSSLSKCITDRRQRGKVQHRVEELLKARVYSIASGYEDANDLDYLRSDPALKVACGRCPKSQADLASQPTFSRLENCVTSKDLFRMGLTLATQVIAQLPADTTEVVLDVDATVDPCHGQQQFELFNRFYDTHCYLPLLLHVTGSDQRQRLLTSLLRPGNASYKTGLFGILRHAVRLVRARFPDAKIILRADAGFGFNDVLRFCDKHKLTFVLGLKGNPRIAVLSTAVQMDACLKYRWAGDGCREFGEFAYKAMSWPSLRRVVVKAEITRGALNPRFVVCNRSDSPEEVYDFYCNRGDQENRIKEMKLDLLSGRTSCHSFMANQMRLLMHTAACVLMNCLQEAAAGTAHAKAQIGTLRLRLLKVAGRVVESCRLVRFHLPTSYPFQEAWAHMHRWLSQPTI